MNAASARLAPATSRSVLAVPGMHCAGCLGKVERALGAVPGVASARANLTARTIAVDHTDAVEIPALVAALAGPHERGDCRGARASAGSGGALRW